MKEQIRTLSWVINNACNLKCIHCYPDSGLERKKRLDAKGFETLSKNLDMKFDRVFISG